MPSELVSKIQAGRKMLCQHLHWVCGWSVGLFNFPPPGGTSEGSWSHWKLWVQSRPCKSGNRSSIIFLANQIPENLLRPISQICFGKEKKITMKPHISCTGKALYSQSTELNPACTSSWRKPPSVDSPTEVHICLCEKKHHSGCHTLGRDFQHWKLLILPERWTPGHSSAPATSGDDVFPWHLEKLCSATRLTHQKLSRAEAFPGAQAHAGHIPLLSD